MFAVNDWFACFHVISSQKYFILYVSIRLNENFDVCLCCHCCSLHFAYWQQLLCLWMFQKCEHHHHISLSTCRHISNYYFYVFFLFVSMCFRFNIHSFPYDFHNWLSSSIRSGSFIMHFYLFLFYHKELLRRIYYWLIKCMITLLFGSGTWTVKWAKYYFVLRWFYFFWFVCELFNCIHSKRLVWSGEMYFGEKKMLKPQLKKKKKK